MLEFFVGLRSDTAESRVQEDTSLRNLCGNMLRDLHDASYNLRGFS